MRKHSSVIQTSLDDAENISGDDNLEGDIIKSEEKRVLHRAIRKLKPEYEQALYLTYFEDFSNRETASIMKKTEKPIWSSLVQTQADLKNMLSNPQKTNFSLSISLPK